MGLFQEVDVEQTYKRVKGVLTNWRRLELILGERYMPKVVGTWSLAPSSPTNEYSNPIDRFMERQEEAIAQMKLIVDAINKLRTDERHILIDKYIKSDDKMDFELYREYGIESTTFYRKLKQSCVSFAWAYKGDDLIVYKKEDS